MNPIVLLARFLNWLIGIGVTVASAIVNFVENNIVVDGYEDDNGFHRGRKK